MSESLKLYGFGSFFSSRKMFARDVDLLLLHEDVSHSSVEFAIRCKTLVLAKIPNSDIVMLSQGEERNLDFINRSGAILLEVIWDEGLHKQVHRLATTLRQSDSC